MPRILVVDEDVSTRASIVSRLSRPHREIATASDGEEALALAGSFDPHLIVTDVVLQRVDGWELVESLRAQPETALTAVIFLSALDSARARVYGLQLGAIDFLGKPFDPDELELRVENALHYSMRSQRVAEVALAEGIAGSLAHVGLSSLLTMLSLDRKTGELRLAVGGDEASLLLREGAIVSASFVRRPEPRGARVVCEVLGWDGGQFAFSERAVTVEDEVSMPTMALLMEAAQLRDESSRGTG